MRVLVFGGQGYMGRNFLRMYPDASAPHVDIADPVAVAAALEEHAPDVVINCAGKTGRPNVDWCEDHKLETLRSNVTGPLVLLEECARRSVYWVHMSSGCIYTGDNEGRGFTEDDPSNFDGSFYARTKAWSDRILREFPVLQLRIRMPFDGSTDPRNLIMKLRNYARVLDAENSLTFLPDALAAAETLIARRTTGTFNVVNAGTMSPFRLMERYRTTVDPSHSFERLEPEALPGVTKAGRSTCKLSGERLAKTGVVMRSVDEAVTLALNELRSAL